MAVGRDRAAHLAPYKFVKGQPPGPGRPLGSRAKLAELAVRLLHKDFLDHGEDVIRRVRERKPEVYLASVVSLLPKQAQKLDSPLVDISDEELEQVEQLLAAMRAKTVRAINGHARARPNRSAAQSEAQQADDRAANGHEVASDAALSEAQNTQGKSVQSDDQTPASEGEGRAVENAAEPSAIEQKNASEPIQ